MLYDGLNAIQELSGTTPVVSRLTGGLDEFFARTDASGTTFPLTDALGSTIALTDATGNIQTQYTYEPFGGTTPSGATSTNAYQFTGRVNDGTGLYYYRARYYSPRYGRFVSGDPMGFGGGVNVYAYAGDNPVSFRDPFGLKRKSVWTCASETAEKVSIAGGLHALGIGTSGAGNFVTTALGGNTFSGISDLVQSIGTGEAAGHNVFYNFGLGLAAGPSLGLGPALGRAGINSLPGPADVATDAIANSLQNLVTGSGQTIQTLNETVQMGNVLGDAAEWGTGFGELKLGYDAATYFGALGGCALGF
jgi:RHS repeat-associated protein